MTQGFFITFEGIEGSGKSTQINLLSKYMEKQGFEVVITREPGGTKLGKKIRSLLLDPEYGNMDYKAEIFLYAADRAQHVKEVIKPALEAGKTVISDRFIDSNLAYQAAGRGLNFKKVYEINSWVIDSCWPDLTFLLDIDIKEGLRRARALSSDQTGDRLEREVDAFHKRVRNAYLDMASEERFVIIDGSRKKNKVQKEIQNITAGRLL